MRTHGNRESWYLYLAPFFLLFLLPTQGFAYIDIPKVLLPPGYSDNSDNEQWRPPFTEKKKPLMFSFGVGMSRLQEGFNNSALPVSIIETDLLLPSTNLNSKIYQISIKKTLKIRPMRFIDKIDGGISIYHTRHILQGDVLEFGQRDLQNFNYKLKNINTSALVEADTVFYTPDIPYLHPFLRLGIGMGFIQEQYDDYVVPGGPVNAEIHLPSQFNFNAAFLVGVGFYLNITPHWTWGVNYSYLHTGSADTATDNIQAPIDVPSTNTHNAFFNITYVR